MAIDWRTVMLAVPWNEVIKRAPKVAEGARKFWSSITAKPQEPDAQPEEPAAPPAASPEREAIAKLETRLAAMKDMVFDLRGQMVASARLITELADQNAQLAGKIDVQRRQIAWLGGAAAVLSALSIAALWLALLG